VAVMGPSGCGKTTLLNGLSGLDDVDAGGIQFEGRDLASLGNRQRTDYRARRWASSSRSTTCCPSSARWRTSNCPCSSPA
jgi:ABC-type lipoprotein export system ATPase subunit